MANDLKLDRSNLDNRLLFLDSEVNADGCDVVKTPEDLRRHNQPINQTVDEFLFVKC